MSVPTRRVLFMTALIPLLAAPIEALAEDGAPTTALVTVPGAQVDRAWADRLARRIATAAPSLDALCPADARARLERHHGARALADAEQRARRAQSALEAFEDLDQTAELHRESSETYLSLLPLLDTLDEPIRLLIGLATVQLALRQSEGVHHALDTALRLDPTLALEPQEVSPRLVRAVDNARERMEGMPLLAPERARALSEQLGVDRIVLLQPRPDRRRTLVEAYERDRGARASAWTVQGTDVREVAAALAPASSDGSAERSAQPEPSPAASLEPEDLGGDLTEFGATPVTEEGDRQRRPFYRTWWFWTIVGAVVGGGAAGVVLGVQASSGDQNLSLEVHSHW